MKTKRGNGVCLCPVHTFFVNLFYARKVAWLP